MSNKCRVTHRISPEDFNEEAEERQMRIDNLEFDLDQCIQQREVLQQESQPDQARLCFLDHRINDLEQSIQNLKRSAL